MALGTYSLDPVHSPVSSCSCVKPQMFLLYANISAARALFRSHCPPFLPKEKKEEAASPIRQASVYVFCRSSKGYISSAKPVKSALGCSLDSTETGTPPFTIQCPELELPSPKFSRFPAVQSLRHSSDLSENSADTFLSVRELGDPVVKCVARH